MHGAPTRSTSKMRLIILLELPKYKDIQRLPVRMGGMAHQTQACHQSSLPVELPYDVGDGSEPHILSGETDDRKSGKLLGG